mgnify:FL=1
MNSKLTLGITAFVFAVLLTFGITSTTNADSTDESTESTINILFIGNSSTYYNRMPLMVEGLADSDGLNVHVQYIAASGYKLSQYATEGNPYNIQIESALNSTKWDYVVLQDHREEILQNLEKSYDALTALKEKIDQNGAQIILFAAQTDYIGRDFTINDQSIYLDQVSLQQLCLSNYFKLGNKMSVPVVTAGNNFVRCINKYPDLSLYNSDLIHPTVLGSYLSACSIYNTIFGKSAYGNNYLPKSEYKNAELLDNISLEDAKKIQNISDPIVKLSTNYIELKKGRTATIKGTLNYNNDNPTLFGFSNTIQYFSLNTDYVSVNRLNGTITALKNGETMVMATADNGVMSLCTVNVIQPSTAFVIKETGITNLHKKDVFTYTTTLEPIDTTDKITWASSNPDVAPITKDGVITAKKLGTTMITATTDSGIVLTRYIRVKLKTPTAPKVKQLTTPSKSYKYRNVRVTWKKNTNAVKYYVYRRKKGYSSYKKIGTTTKTTFDDSNKRRGATFYYKIVSVYSNEKCNSFKSPYGKITVK